MHRFVRRPNGGRFDHPCPGGAMTAWCEVAVALVVAGHAHDYTGAGSLRETFLVQAGVPLNRIMPIAYVRSASHNIMNPVAATPVHPRDHYQADKTSKDEQKIQRLENGTYPIEVACSCGALVRCFANLDNIRA